MSIFWKNFARLAILTDPYLSIEKQWYLPSDERLFEAECATIRRITNKCSAIFLGSCSWYVLRDHPHHVRILVTADQPFRVKPLCDLYKLSEVGLDNAVDLAEKCVRAKLQLSTP